EAFNAGEPRRLDEGAGEVAQLSVLDRELSSLLGARCLYCEPLRAGGRTEAVLVIGYNSSEIDYYLDQSLSVPLFKQTLADLLLAAGPGTFDASAELLHQQRVREVIHEVNN